MTHVISKTEKQHGGRRPGAGRKKKDRTPQGRYESAQAYLEAVVMGDVEPDQIRVQAAKALLAYETPKQRAKPKSKTPRKLAEMETKNIEKENQDAFEKRAARVREKFKIIQGENSK